MNPAKQETFIAEFYSFSDPQPNLTQFSEQQLKSNDMKISLQIGSSSYLRMQSDTKSHMISFSCKNYGKSCYEIFARKHNKSYQITSNYKQIKHNKNCELKNQAFEYLKIYNLMKLKKNHIEAFMIENGLLNSSPSQILLQISRKQAYFFQERILYNSDMRRKLRKRFDNIVNIDIKKITKGGRDNCKNQSYSQNDPQQNKAKQDDPRQPYNLRQNDGPQYTIKKDKEIDKSKIFRRPKLIKKKLVSQKHLRSHRPISQLTKLNQAPIFQQSTNLPCQQIFLSQPQPMLKQIQQLNGQLNQFDDIFSWSLQDDRYKHNYSQTINDKLRDNEYFVSMIGNGQGSFQNLSQLQLFPNFDQRIQ